MTTLNRNLAELGADDAEFFTYAFTDPRSGKPYEIPADLKRLAIRLCRSYGIGGICDPMYVANIIAFELGLGDGLSHFNAPKTKEGK